MNINNIIRIIMFLIILYILDFTVLANIIVLSLILSELVTKIKDLIKESDLK